MEIIQEIGSYAGLAAVVGLAVLSALYFSQARDVKRLREWAGRAPERTDVPQPTRVVARPVPKAPGQTQPPTRPAVPGTPAASPAPAAKPVGTPTPTPQPATAAASAAGATPAVATGPAAATPAAARAGEGAQTVQAPGGDSANGTEEGQAPSQDTVVHPPTTPADAEPDEPDTPDEDQEAREGLEEGTPDHEAVEADDEAGHDEPDELDPDDPEAHWEDTGDYEPVPPSPPAPPPRPTIPIDSARAESGEPSPILPPYAESRPGAGVTRRPRPGRGGVMSSPRRAVFVVGGALLATALVAFGVLQLTGGDDASTPTRGESGGSASEPGTAKKKKPAIVPANVTVAVLNGTTVPGLAAQIGDSIERQGFKLGTITNFIDQQKAESVVMFAPGAEREAAEVGRRLKIAQRQPVDAESQGIAGDAAVVVVAGADKTQ